MKHIFYTPCQKRVSGLARFFISLGKKRITERIRLNRKDMEHKMILSAVFFMMKYFFDVEKEITQTLVTTLHLRLMDCKELAVHACQLIAQK